MIFITQHERRQPRRFRRPGGGAAVQFSPPVIQEGD